MYTLVVTVGHTSTKLSLHKNQPVPLSWYHHNSTFLEHLMPHIGDFVSETSISRVLFATTNHSIDHEVWIAHLQAICHCPVEMVTTKHIFSNPAQYNLPKITAPVSSGTSHGDSQADQSEVGVDILCNLAASRYHHPKCNLIIVDLGTIQTITAIYRNNQFLGVAIAPGGQVVASSIHWRVPHLPDINFDDNNSPCLGQNTAQAMQSGSYWMVDCYIRHVIEHIQKKHFAQEKATVVFTGGGKYGRSKDRGQHEHHIADLMNQGLWLITAK